MSTTSLSGGGSAHALPQTGSGYQYGSSSARASAASAALCKKKNLTPPLPLVKFQLSKEAIANGPKTINGEELRSIPNETEACDRPGPPDPLFDPICSRRLSKWFSARSQREVNNRQTELFNRYCSEANAAAGTEEPALASLLGLRGDLFEYAVYESLLHIESKEERRKRNERRLTEEQVYLQRAQLSTPSAHTASKRKESTDESTHHKRTAPSSSSAGSTHEDAATVSSVDTALHSEGETRRQRASSSTPSLALRYSPSLVFDAEFESGNLERATRVIGRETLMDGRACEHLHDLQTPREADQEYDLVLRNDLFTDGNIQWYYFCVSVDPDTVSALSFPLTVRFNIVNMQKRDSLYNYGMKPAVLSIHDNHVLGKDWAHRAFDVCYYKNGLTGPPSSSSSRKKKVLRSHYTLTFTYTFERPDTVYFAHSFPYTYSDLQRYLQSLETRCENKDFFHRRVLCETLAGNRCDLLTITERAEALIESKSKPAVIISARVHPGETNSSFMVQGLLDFLCSDSVEAQKLRKAFIFTVVPMLNPDGVIHGNYRCSLAGTDLNRRYADAHESMHPTVSAMRELIRTIKDNRLVALYLDLHGHSRQKNAFVYGCDITMQPEKISAVLLGHLSEEEINAKRIFCRVFPKILCTVSKACNGNGGGYFSYRDCAFRVQKSKMGTSRVVCWRDLGVMASYTIETSFCGNGDNSELYLLGKHFEGVLSKLTRTSASAAEPTNSSTITAVATAATAAGNDNGNFSEKITTSEGSSKNPNTDNDKSNNVNTNSSKNGDGFAGIESLLGREDKPLDPSLQGLLAEYKDCAHYQKRDLLAMGKHIAQAIFHYANLTHTDIARELELLKQQNERETAAKLLLKSTGINRPQTAQQRTSTLSKTNKANAVFPQRHEKKITRGNIFKPSHLSSHSSDNSDGTAAKSRTRIDAEQLFEDGEESKKNRDDENENDNDYEDDEDDEDDEDEENNEEEESLPRAKDDTEIFVHNSNSASSRLATSKKISALAAARNAANEIVNRYKPLYVDSFDETMTQRSLVRPGVFSADAMQSTLNQYCGEYVVDRSTRNLGLRIKCELALRRALNLDRKLNLERLLSMEYDEAHPPEDNRENDNRSDEGSDSDPSVDNQNAAKLLKNMKRFKTTGSLVSALRAAIANKKKKEAQREKKNERKLLDRLAKQAEEAKKQQLLEEEKALAERRVNRRRASNYMTSSVSVKDNTISLRKVVDAVPRYSAPNYRLAPESKVNVPVQIKMMGFRDCDHPPGSPRRRGMGPIAPVEPQPRRQSFAIAPSMDSPPLHVHPGFLGTSGNPNLANILISNNKNNSGKGIFDLLPGLGLYQESNGVATPPHIDETPFAAALRLKNAVLVNNHNDAVNPSSPRLVLGSGSGKVRRGTVSAIPRHPERPRPISSSGLRKSLYS